MTAEGKTRGQARYRCGNVHKKKREKNEMEEEKPRWQAPSRRKVNRDYSRNEKDKMMIFITFPGPGEGRIGRVEQMKAKLPKS